MELITPWLSTRYTLQAYLEEKRKKKKKPKTYVHVTSSIVPEFHVGGAGLKLPADILKASPNDSNMKPGCGTTSGVKQLPYTT